MFGADQLGSKTTTEHRAKLACVYIRQSSLGQVTRHRESTDLQYQLVEYAVQLGWPRERVRVVDEDLGKSGTSVTERAGFQNLMAEVGLGKVGLVLSFDASRLARNNRDWYQLLELCSVFGTLIADSERVYDPGIYTDRLLLGLSGLMSEAELHQIKKRLHAGAWNKAARGELRQPLPVGLMRLPTNEVVLHPNEEVQARIRLVFDKFQELGIARAVMRYFHEKNLLLPSRPLRGPVPHEVVWQPVRNSMVLAILKNPAYAGTYVYGRQTKDPTRRKAGHPHSGIVRRPLDEWPIVIHNTYPAYITWETFLANQAQLAANQNCYREDRPGAPKKGQALLQGILRCGRCGVRMRLRYSGARGEFPVYECTYAQSEYGARRCQEVRGLGLDAEVERLVLEALTPDKLTLALAALGALEQEYAALRRQRELHLERIRYEATRAQRQYDAVEPENRLVARALERRWEEKLRALEKAEQEYQTWTKQERLELTAKDRQDIINLGADLPQVWNAPSTTAADRKQILRFLIQEVIVDQKRAQGKVWFQINWQTGAISEHWYIRRVRSYAEHARFEQIQQRIRELHEEQKLDDEIAAILNTEGFRTTKRGRFDNNTIWLLRQRMGLPAVKPNGSHPTRWEDGTYSVQGAAQVIGVFPGTIYKWLRTNRLEGYQLRKGTPWKIYLSPEQINELKDYVERVRRSKKEAL
ncbi:MAG: recombinase family protein [bacterium]|nr:recombinase family protein [bacterium]